MCLCDSLFFFFLMIRRPPRSTQSRSSAASDVYKRQVQRRVHGIVIALALVLTLLGASVGEAIYLKISPVYVIFMSWGFLVNAYLIFKSFWRKSRGVITWHGRAYRIVDGELRSADKISKEKH
eukprot:TRINITY_DN2367_c0_g2_i4.p2 TRINITY_DN2367_c0_g2~~TRINITY_DN2367_c0_g2_i4.p2  ORF type:complete len:123 (-),score=21.23 TRINITY_DN2367_c0_g2_i4:35-403(-)